MIKEKLSTKSNNYIDLDNFNLNSDESIIEIKFEFGDVDVNFKSEEPQNFYLKVKKNLIDEDIIINKTKIDGKYRNTSLTSEDSVNTKIKNEKKEETKTLPGPT